MTERVLGPTGSPRRRWSLLAPVFLIALVGLFVIAGAQAVNQTGAFELDGNAVSSGGNAGTGPDDWDRVCQETGFAGGCSTTATTQTTAPKATAVSFISAVDNPIIFTGGGSKDPQDPQDSWLWKPSDTIPDKDTILHAFAAKYSLAPSASTCPSNGAATCDVIFFGSDRFTNDGDAQLGFWFFKAPVARTNVASQGGFTFTGHHTNGDLLVISDFSSGGTTSTIKVYFWDSSCGSDNTAANKIYNDPTVGQCGANNLRLHLSSDAANCGTSNATAAACGIVNPTLASDPAHQTAPWPFVDKKGNTNFYDQGEFYEAGINLSALGLGGTCFASFEAESRASTSATATLKALAIGGFGACTSGLVTTPSAGKGGSVQIGSNGTYSATDSAALTITGAASWTGTLKFFICAPLASGSCDGTTNVGTQVGSDRTVTNATAQPFVSDPYSVTAAGRYCWRAEFISGTTGVPNAKDGSADECFTVTPLTPTISTQLKLASNNTNLPASVAVGTTVYDTAALSGGTSNAGGTVRYRLYTNNTCTTADASTEGAAFNTQTDKAVTNGVALKSDNITLNTAGTFYFQATYQTGDANNVAGAVSVCSSEAVTVQATPAVHSTPQVQIRDHITVSGLSSSPAPTGNVVVGIFTENTCTTRLTGNSDQSFAIGAGPFDTTFVGVPNGDYYFKISYAGDAANTGFTSCVERATVSNLTSVT
jgi:hypothetical protein